MTFPTVPALDAFYRGRRVLVTGHTGFKGAWLCEWLLGLGAEVHGVALPPDTDPSLFETLELRTRLEHHELDVLERAALQHLLRELRPDVVIHLAAQSLVLRSHEQPLLTLDTNVTGTANLLAAVGAAGYSAGSPCAVVCVTSDKCYANDDTGRPCPEHASMGGRDLYSASKGMVELLAAAWRNSFYQRNDGPSAVRLATARAGNVIGGGDQSRDRIVVDGIAALQRGEPIAVRSPDAVRPWQHVLEPLSGYLRLGERLFTTPRTYESGWNFGPGPGGERSVADLCTTLIDAWGDGSWQAQPVPANPREAKLLRLSIRKARTELGWRPTWNFATTVQRTVEWYRAAAISRHDPATMQLLTQAQIAAFTAAGTPRPPRELRDRQILVPTHQRARR